MMTINISFFLSSNSENAKNKILKKIKDLFKENDMLPYISDTNFKIEHDSDSWEFHIYHVLKICNLLGREWILLGNIEETFEGWSNRPRLSGIASIHINSDNPLIYNEEYFSYVNSIPPDR
ncbi:hypothetical protein N8E87_10465 [Avibacterium paragallinarum]|nr:hypothetical protein [Avibacterium paragallinarum]UXN36575.1 hypothetical protein N8E87_10465 [Avibacterium paragallinarum]